ncbi:hypothetical protein BBJ28_00010825 [Nothophytophthora sp. Chile5]|nr:hypothetical protein BBJ28_00010825 [Nothophytophthora sp. Chile5]
MGVIKKTALLGASAPPEKSGSSVIEGDRKLLSHYGSASTKQQDTSMISARRSNIRQNLIAKGLARQYEGQKAREDVYKGQVPRYERQRRILETYHRQQTRHAADEHSAEPKGPGSGEDDDEFSENVVLVLRKRMTSAPSKSSTRSTRHMSPIVPPKGAMSFPRNTSLRQLTESQQKSAHEELAGDERRMRQAEAAAARLKGSPSEADVARVLQEAVALPSSCASPRTPVNQPLNASTRPVEPQQLNTNVPGAPAAWLSAVNRSSMIVLCELNVTKEIVLREQVIQQLQLALPIVDAFARDLLKLREEKTVAEAVVGAARAVSPSRLKKLSSMIGITSTALLEPDTGDAQHAVVEAEKTVARLATLSQELAAKARHRVRQVETLLGGLQQATLSVVEGIVEWRRLRQQQRKRSNFQRLFRFPRKQRKIANYLLHLSDDLRSLFPSAALELLLGPQASFNPLLLSRKVLQLIRMPEEEGAWTTRTFLTERQSDGFGDEAAHLTGQLTRKDARRSSAGGSKSAVLPEELPLLYEALVNALNALSAAEKKVSSPVKPPTAVSEHQTRLRRCLEAISHEKELEALDKQRHGEDEQRLRGAYDPFSGIKAAGGVEETLTNLMELQSPKAPQLGEQLRFRQENAANSAVASAAIDSEGPRAAVEVLQVNPVRLRQLLEQRMDQHESATDCELLAVQRWGVKNKLRGQVMVRKINTRRFEHHLARKIQLQYLVYRTRKSIQSNLTHFVRNIRVSVVNIQRVFRGHRAKCEYESMRQVWLEQRHRVAAVRTIANTFRRYRRRQRHRRSMTVESVAQVQLMTLLETRLHDASEAQQAAERYRRVGEERRRQRIVLLQKHKMEQQALERKRMTAAVRLQSVVRSHLAQGQARVLRQEKKAHMTAVCVMTIQSKVRRFLDHQQERRRRFRRDLERVNQSAVRIQSIYRGYNSRASLLGQLDERMWQTFNRGLGVSTQHGDGKEEEEGFDDDESDGDDDVSDDQSEGDAFSEGPSGVHVSTPDDRLPPLVPSSSRPSSSNNSTEDRRPPLKSASHPPVSLPPLQVRVASSSLSLGLATTPSSGRRPSTSSLGMTRAELKLKEPVIGDDFATPPSRRNSFVGRMQRQ